jgi:ATP-dependent helicase/nuclease subunit A
MMTGIQIISASAGSGKTYRLTGELEQALRTGSRPEAILATTFTRKAAAELIQRVRLRLLEQGLWDVAQSIPDGYVGTVNSVCGALLRDFAFEAGLSPDQQIIPDSDEFAVFNTAIAPVLREYARTIGPLARNLSLGPDDWTDAVRRVITQARANGLEPAQLQDCAEKSWLGMRRIMADPLHVDSAPELDAHLKTNVTRALKALTKHGDSTQKTAKVVDILRDVSSVLRTDAALSWCDWVRLSKLDPGKAGKEHVAPVIEAASVHPIHPRFHQDVEQYIRRIFTCAAEGMEAFAAYKRREGLIDYVDQESLTCRLLCRDDVRQRLTDFLDIVFVDEFQDTSPIELAVFLKLAGCVERSVWVGDQKQAIYGFRGTDPLLMDAAVNTLLHGRGPDILEHNWRSRPELVDFANRVFVPAFGAKGMRDVQVRLHAKRGRRPTQANALEVWSLNSTNNPTDCACIASGIAELLADPSAHLIEDRTTKELRPLRGGDIAVLCRKNDVCRNVADAIELLGHRTRVRRTGLLKTLEAVFVLAALRYLVDPRDTLAVAELLHLRNEPDWLGKWLENPPGAEQPTFWKCHPAIAALDRVRTRLIDLTPQESLDLAISACEADVMVCRWGDTQARLANLDALRGLARGYEEISQVRRNAATAAGLVTYLYQEVAGNTELDLQGEGLDEDAVNVLTYHKAKGLEWPFVVLAELGWTMNVAPFGVSVEPTQTGFDPLRPLADRWVRYWPWPYGPQKTKTGLEARLEEAPELARARARFWSEEARVMYVGMTRARDYLALAVRGSGKNVTAWLDLLQDDDGTPVLDVSSAAQGHVLCQGRPYPALHRDLNAQDATVSNREETCFASTRSANTLTDSLPIFPPARFNPSHAASQAGDEALVGAPERIGPRIPVAGKPDVTALGEAIHGFLAQDASGQSGLGLETRTANARAICERWGAVGIPAQDLVAASDRLIAHLADRYGDGVALTEQPIRLRISRDEGNQIASGWIDLIWQTQHGSVIVDHKSYLGQSDTVKKHCTAFVPQLNVYADCLEIAHGQKPLALLVHLPMIGLMVEIERRKT